MAMQAPLPSRLRWLAALAATGSCWLVAPAAAQITPTTGGNSLGSMVNGPTGPTDSCTSGSCGIGGGTLSGDNLFHRFDAFDTRHGITKVTIDNRDAGSVFVGVTHPMGTFIDVPVKMQSSAGLYLISPGGIWVGDGASFSQVADLSLTTSNVVRFEGGGSFHAFTTTDVGGLGGSPRSFPDAFGVAGGFPAGGDITIALGPKTGTLAIAGDLLMDAPGGNVVFEEDNTIPASGSTPGTLFVTEPSRVVVDGGTLELGLDLTTEGGWMFADGGALAFTEPGLTWTITDTSAVALGYDPQGTYVGPPFPGSPLREGRLAGEGPGEGPVVAGPDGGTVTVNLNGEMFKSTDSDQELRNVDLRILASPQNPLYTYGKPKTEPYYTGRLHIANGGLALDNASISELTGSIFLLGDATLTLQQSELRNEGFVGGNGILTIGGGSGTLTNFGVVAPGLVSAAGRLSLQGNLVQPSSATNALITTDLAGPGPGQPPIATGERFGDYDRLTITGSASIQGGTIAAFLRDGYRPDFGDAFRPVITAAGGLNISSNVRQQLPGDFTSVVEDNRFDLLFGSLPNPNTDLFLLLGGEEGGSLDGQALAAVGVNLDTMGFGLLGGSEGSLGSIGDTTTLDAEEALRNLQQEEVNARDLVRSSLGVEDAGGTFSESELRRSLCKAKYLERGMPDAARRCNEGP